MFAKSIEVFASRAWARARENHCVCQEREAITAVNKSRDPTRELDRATALSFISNDLGHGDTRGRYAEHVYLRTTAVVSEMPKAAESLTKEVELGENSTEHPDAQRNGIA